MTKDGSILVVDDEIVIRALLVDILTEEGYAVETAGSARDALNLLQQDNNFVILFTDIMMPEMDGIELIREARKITPTVIPIVMTGFATLETARAAVKEGAYDYVLKPFSLSEIKLAVTNAIERHRLENENARLREINELFNISEKITGMRDEEALLDFVLRAALDRVGARRGSLMVTTPDGKALEVAASVGLPEEAAKTIVEMGRGISGMVAKSARPLLVEDIGQSPDIEQISRRLQGDSFVSVPLEQKWPSGYNGPLSTIEPHVLGVLNVTDKKDGSRFTEGDLKILSIVANHAAAALENARLIKSVEDAHLSTLQSIALLLEAKDAYTHGHSQRVRNYSVWAARRLGMAETDIEVLRLGAALHDVGKVGVKDGILNKRGEPTPEEWETIRRHPLVGYEVLMPVRVLRPEHRQLVRGHHERMDGSGYPDGLPGDQLSPVTRVIIVADAYDAMASDRAYRSALSPAQILEQLKQHSGTQFDPQVANAFVELVESGKTPPQE
ncbi:MAG: response regulator [Candidatus Hydrogenedentes bacterium]|nr:response regulator [Candidatus Hydrogenedentota bacterium]